VAGSRAILWIMAFGFVGFGAAFTLWPQAMARLVEVPLPTPTARIDFAATYGGFQMGFGAFLLACVRRREWLAAGLWAGALALAGFGVVRLLSLIVSGGPVSSPIFVGLALEISGVVLNLLALWLLRRSRESAFPRRR
jgi:hypothetical protein